MRTLPIASDMAGLRGESNVEERTGGDGCCPVKDLEARRVRLTCIYGRDHQDKRGSGSLSSSLSASLQTMLRTWRAASRESEDENMYVVLRQPGPKGTAD